MPQRGVDRRERIAMREKMVVDKEYLEVLEDTVDAMSETLEILSNPEVMEDLEEAKERVHKKDYKTTEQVRKILGL